MHALWFKALLHRYLGTWLETRSPVDQLSMNLTTGILELEQLELSCETVNTALAKSNVPVRLTDGWLGRVRLEVPWKEVMTTSTTLSVEDVQLTFRKEDEPADVEGLASMISSVLTTLSHETVASNVMQNVSARNAELQDDGTSGSLADFVRTLSSKFCMEFKNVTIRFEDETTSSELAAAVEIHIEELRFADVAEQDSKKLIVRGVSIYTDVFSQTAGRCDEEGDEQGGQDDSFYSCYETLSQQRPEASDVFSDPIKIAEVVGEVVCTIRSADVFSDRKRAETEVEVSIEKLNVFGTASQAEVLKRFFATTSSSHEGPDSFRAFEDPKKQSEVNEDEAVRDEFRVDVYMNSFALIIPHADPLSTDFCDQNGGFIASRSHLKRASDGFFESSDSSYDGDHLKITARSPEVRTNLDSVNVTVGRFEALECLRRDEQEEQEKVPLLMFPKHEDDVPDVKMTLRSSDGRTELDVELRTVRSELDVSILDRIANLIAPTPFFNELSTQLRKEDVLEDSERAVVINVKCTSWQVDVRIPQMSQRHLHDEFLRFNVKDVDVTVKEASVDLICQELIGELCGKNLEVPKRFLQAGGPEMIFLKVLLNSNPTPKEVNVMTNSSLLMAPATEEGPFSTIPRTYIPLGGDKIDIVQAGSRTEMLEFQDTCQKFASVCLVVDVPILKMHVPEKKHLELFFNRIVNDLAAFKPRLRKEDHEKVVGSSDSEDSDDSEDFDRSVPHGFSLNLNVKKASVVCNTEASQVALDLRHVHIGTTTGYHGDANHVFFHLTSSKVAVGTSDSENHITDDIRSKLFGRWSKEMSQMEHVAKTSSEDALAVSVRLHKKPDFNATDVLLALALRNTELKARPFKTWKSSWMGRLAELFDLEDTSGADVPKVATRLHVNLDDVFIGYDHSWLKLEPCDLKLMVAVGKCNIWTSLGSDARILKSMLLLENCRLSMSQKSQFVRILEFGSVEMEIMCAVGKEAPIFELRCTNDVMKASACADSLATLIKTVNELLESTEENGEGVVKQKPRKARTLSEEDERRIQEMIADAMNYEEDVDHEDVRLQVESRRSSSEIDVDGFCHVDPSLFGSTDSLSNIKMKTSDQEQFAVIRNFYTHIDENDADRMQRQIGGDHLPAFRYILKNFSIQLDLYAGNDLSPTPSALKIYSSRLFRKSRGGPFRDHSAFVTLQLRNITYFKQIFEKTAPFLSTTLLEIKDIVATNHLKSSNIKGMLYQVSSAEQPSRTVAPLLSVRMMTSPKHDAKMRVSMQDVKLNLDQDTLEFLNDFYEETTAILGVQTASKAPAPVAPRLPTMNAPEVPREMSSWPLRPTALVIPAPLGDLSYLEKSKKTSTPPADDILMRSTMIGSIYPTLIDTEDQIEEEDGEGAYANFLDGLDDDREESEVKEEIEKEKEEEEEDCSDDVYFTQFVFCPTAQLFVDYDGSQKVSISNCATLIGMLKTFAQLSKLPIQLEHIDTRCGLLGVSQCFSYAAEHWTAGLETTNLAPRVLASVAPISPLFDVGNGVVNLFAMPVREFQKENGSVVKGVQRGVGSFGASTAAGLVGMAHTVTGIVQSLAEMTINEVQVKASDEKPSRRRYNTDPNSNPTDIRQGLQQAYGTLHDGYHQTCSDLQLASRESRSSVVRSALRFAVPTVLAPVAIITQASNQIFSGFRNQLRPDDYKDERQKYGEKDLSSSFPT